MMKQRLILTILSIYMAVQLSACGSSDSTSLASLPAPSHDGHVDALAVPTAHQEKASSTPSAPLPAIAVSAPFDAAHPRLAGIALGASREAVLAAFGSPQSQYTLPDEDSSIEMNEYAGITVGCDEKTGFVLYIEVYSSQILTDVDGLKVGMSDSQAGHTLGITLTAASNVLSIPVTGGLLKLDLDPDSRVVQSIKLIGQDVT